MNGYISTNCPECAALIKVEAVFPAHNAGFKPIEHTCPACGAHMLTADPHKYDADGTIREVMRDDE